MRKISITVFLFIVGITISFGQSIGRTDWISEEDFREDESIIVDNILWLEENPFATEANDTKAISEYVLQWLTEAPHLSVRLDEVFTDGIVKKKYKYGDKMLVTYLFGKSVYTIENQEESSEVNASVRGLVGMLKVYQELLKVDLKAYNKTLDFYSDMHDKGNLDDYVRNLLESRGFGS